MFPASPPRGAGSDRRWSRARVRAGLGVAAVVLRWSVPRGHPSRHAYRHTDRGPRPVPSAPKVFMRTRRGAPAPWQIAAQLSALALARAAAARADRSAAAGAMPRGRKRAGGRFAAQAAAICAPASSLCAALTFEHGAGRRLRRAAARGRCRSWRPRSRVAVAPAQQRLKRWRRVGNDAASERSLGHDAPDMHDEARVAPQGRPAFVPQGRFRAAGA